MSFPDVMCLLFTCILFQTKHLTFRSGFVHFVMRKRCIAFAKTKTQISCAVTAQLISVFIFAAWIVQSLFFLNLKFQASSLFLRLCRLVCVIPGQEVHRPIFGVSSVSLLIVETTIYEPPRGKTNNVVSEQV